MIIVRAPLRISFVGGGTDLKSFYSQYPGRVISASINKFVYVVLNQADFLNQFIMKYAVTEVVKHPKELIHDRFRESLLDLDLVTKGLEIASFTDFPFRTGLGSSSSFSVALLKALYAHKGKTVSNREVAEAASRLEIDILKEPIGKQDQYAAAFGGFNMFQFNADGSVLAEPVFLDFKTRASLEDHALLYFTGIKREAKSVLGEQKDKVSQNLETYKKMSDSVPVFRDKILTGDFKGMAEMLHEGWLRKKTLSSNVSNSAIDTLYEAAMSAGAWGGKILGAGGGGCLFFLAPPEKHKDIVEALNQESKKLKHQDFQEVPVEFSQSGADVLFNSSQHHHA